MHDPDAARGRRLLVVTGLWPTEDQPSAGIFVQRRLAGVNALVIGPKTYQQPMPLRYMRLAIDAVRPRSRFVGVEAHVLFPAGLIGLLAARLRGIPLVVVAHGSDVTVTAQENTAYRRLAQLVARRAARVVANSADMAQRIRELAGVDAVVVTPGVDLDIYRPSPRPSSSSRRVLYLGGRRDEKGWDRANGVADTMAGPGLQDIAPGEVAALIASHDVVLVPSRAEGFGLVAAEAIASGRWVVASAVGGLAELVTDGINGTLVEGEDFAAAVAAVPDYDPFAVAATMAAYSLDAQRERMRQLWAEVL